MTRRTFLCAVPAGVLAGAGCSDPVKRNSPGPRPATTGPPEDIRLTLLRHAVLAPSSHNTQPWLVALGPDRTIDLYVDTRRLLPLCDPLGRQTSVSQGTFLEVLNLAAAEYGLVSGVAIAEEESLAADGRAPIARITLTPDRAVRKDPLFRFVRNRQTSKRPFDGRRCPESVLQALVGAGSSESTAAAAFDAEATRRRLADLCTDAMRVDVSSPSRNAETAGWFRFSDEEARRSPDGFGLAASGAGGMAKWVAETFLLSRESAEDPHGRFASGAVDSARTQAQTAAGFGIITTPGNTRLQQVRAGRAYIRTQLTATALGVQLQPFSQALQEYPEMRTLHRQLRGELAIPEGHTIQMLYRIGYADAAPRTLRRDVRDLLRRG